MIVVFHFQEEKFSLVCVLLSCRIRVRFSFFTVVNGSQGFGAGLFWGGSGSRNFLPGAGT